MHIQRVIEVSKRYFPQTAVGFDSPKVKVHIQDGAEFMQQCAGQFDVIISDISDPAGEGSTLLARPSRFFLLVLSPDPTLSRGEMQNGLVNQVEFLTHT